MTPDADMCSTTFGDLTTSQSVTRGAQQERGATDEMRGSSASAGRVALSIEGVEQVACDLGMTPDADMCSMTFGDLTTSQSVTRGARQERGATDEMQGSRGGAGRVALSIETL